MLHVKAAFTKECCTQHVANCCLGVRPPLETIWKAS
jgi:hypothetical protein